jgi:hypothetical protein
MKLLFVYSSLDADSISLFKDISGIEDLKKVTLPVDASHPHINSILKTSKNIVINGIPTIIKYGSPDGEVLKYEGVESVAGFVSDVRANLAEENATPQPSITPISDLELEEEEQETFAPHVTHLTQPQVQNMPIKSKRGASQTRKIEDFRAQREAPHVSQTADNSDPGRIKITSPPMTR